MTRDPLRALAADMGRILAWLWRVVVKRWDAADSKLSGQSADVSWGRRG